MKLQDTYVVINLCELFGDTVDIESVFPKKGIYTLGESIINEYIKCLFITYRNFYVNHGNRLV